jgi:hypothetical protein
MDGVTDGLLAAGPLGAVIVALGFAFWKQGITLKTTQEARVEDAKKVTATLLELNDKWNTTVGALAQAVNELRASITARR